ADDVAVDIAVADAEPVKNVAHRVVDTAVDAEGERKARRGDLVDNLVESIGVPAHDMKDRAKHLAGQTASASDLEGAWSEEGAVFIAGWQGALVKQFALAPHPLGMFFKSNTGVFVDDRADIGR